MKVINKHNCLQVKDFVSNGGMELEPQEAVFIAIWHDENGVFHESPIYKWECAADDSEVYLYLNGSRPTKRAGDSLKE